MLVRLWDAHEDGGWTVHDYLTHNKPADEVRRIQHERRVGGKKGGRPTDNLEGKPSVTAEVNLTGNPSTSTATATTTAIETATATAPASARATLVTPRRKDAAWEGPRVYVPQRAHRDFLAFRGGLSAEGELLAWYQAVSDAWELGGARAAEEPGADMFAFWKARYTERWPASAATPARAQAEPWACPHVDHCAHRAMCANKITLGTARYPLKSVAS